MLGVAQSIRWDRSGSDLTIHTPALSVDDLLCHYAYVFGVTGVKEAHLVCSDAVKRFFVGRLGVKRRCASGSHDFLGRAGTLALRMHPAN